MDPSTNRDRIDRDELLRKAEQCIKKWCSEGADWLTVADAVPKLLDELEAAEARYDEQGREFAAANELIASVVAFYHNLLLDHRNNASAAVNRAKESETKLLGVQLELGESQETAEAAIATMQECERLMVKRGEQWRAAEARVSRLRSSIQDALPYISDSHARITLTNALEETK